MGSTSNPAVTNNVFEGGYNASYASIFSLMAFPQWYPELVKRYGAAFEIFEFLKFAGQETTCAGQTKTMFEVGAPERYITTYGSTATALVGANISLKILEWGGGSSGVASESYLTVGDKVAIPAAYCTVSGSKPTMPQWYQVVTKGTVQNPEKDTTFTCTPLNALTVLGTAVPTGTKLMVTGGNYAPGSAGAKPKTKGYYSRTFTTAIKRTAFKIEGSQQSNERYTDHLVGGGMGIFSEASIQAEFRHNQALNYEILLGNTADNLTMADADSVSNSVRGTLGIMPHLEAGGCQQYYTTSYTIPDFDMIKKAFISQGVVDTSAAMFVGAELLRGIENSGLEFVKEYAGGTTLIQNLNNLHVDFKIVKKNGIELTLHELVSFSNPNTLGNYSFDKKGFVIPNSQVTVRDGELGADVKLANVTLSYKNFQGENRERIFKVIPGVNGLSMIPGNVAVNSYDSASWEILTEFMLIMAKRNQGILIQPDDVL
jgi:hypothetical protein